jgi:hypothetical protein
LEAQQQKSANELEEAVSRLSIADRDIAAMKDQLIVLQSSESELRAENQQVNQSLSA